MALLTDEGLSRTTARMTEAADRMERAADRIEAATHRLALMLEDGYGGNGLKLIELLESTTTPR